MHTLGIHKARPFGRNSQSCRHIRTNVTKHEHRLTYLTGIELTFQVSHESGDARPLSRLRHSYVELKGCWRDVEAQTWQHCAGRIVIVAQIPGQAINISICSQAFSFSEVISANVDHVAAASVITFHSLVCWNTRISTLHTPFFTLYASNTQINQIIL